MNGAIFAKAEVGYFLYGKFNRPVLPVGGEQISAGV